MIFDEFFGDFQKYYKAPFPLKDKVVLDVGAGNGETALLWFSNGAKKVLCIESNPSAFSVLKENSNKNSWNVELFNEKLSAERVRNLQFDYMKCDCEGGETELLKLDSLKPSVIEAHSPQLISAFQLKFNMELFKTYSWHTGLAGLLRNF